MFDQKKIAEAAAEVAQLCSLLELRPNDVILDLCCGVGRHSIALARHGCRVTGVDSTLSYLEAARSKLNKSEQSLIEFIHADMRQFLREGFFNAALIMYSSLGYFEDPEENLKVLKNVYLSLKEGGVLVVDVINKNRLLKDYKEKSWQQLGEEFLLLERKIINNSKIAGRWIVVNKQGISEFKMSCWIYSASELSSMLKSVGFSRTDFYADCRGTGYGEEAKRLVAIARK